CDGVRPVCGACSRRRQRVCEYPVREGAVSRYADLKETVENLERENREFRELLAILRMKPEREAFEVYRRLRASASPSRDGASDALIILQHFKDAETLLPPPGAPESPSPYYPAELAERPVVELDSQCLASSPLKVPARPWTAVAGDGLVSHLISSFFRWDDPFIYSFIDREPFLRDMRRCSGPDADVSQAEYCSPFLVNAICALRSFFSDKAKVVNRVTKCDIGSRFLAEAKKHLDLEGVKASLPTVQGLYLLFLVSCCEGTNRAGSMYRFASCEMLYRMRPEKLFAQLRQHIAAEAERKRALSKTSWGLFNFECILAHTYLRPPMLRIPAIPCVFDYSSRHSPNLDVLGNTFGPGSPEPPMVPGAVRALCDLAVLQHNVMNYNAAPPTPIGDEEDMRKRREWFSQLASTEESMPTRLRHSENPAPQTLYLKVFTNVIAYNIIRPLKPSCRFLDDPRFTVRSLIIQFCACDVEMME
ncbi:nitrogen assimilation transcription factor nirA, partial [Diplogelasinospora grovesii]